MVKARVWDYWRRAETGKIVPERDFETKIFFPKVTELVKQYGIKYDPEDIVPTDKSLMDDVYKAGMELLLEVGIYCTDTEKIIEFEEWEVKEAVRTPPKEVTLGEGNDAVAVVARKLEDRRRPFVSGGPMCVSMSEEWAVKIYESHAKEPANDGLVFGTLISLEGMRVKANAPIEMHAERRNIAFMREATNRVGRPGMGLIGSPAVSVGANVGASDPERGWRKCDYRHAYILPDLKTDYITMSIVAHYMEYGSHYYGCGTPGVGGLSGGPEGTTITNVAEGLASQVLYQPSFLVTTGMDAIKAPGCSSRAPMWSGNLASAAIADKTDLVNLGNVPYVAFAGPCTDMILYEIAALSIGCTVTGGHPAGLGPLSGTGLGRLDCTTGMESRFMGEVARAATKLKLEDANEIVKKLNAKYQDNIDNDKIPLGKTFQECYDTATLTPSKEYVEIYSKVKKELEDLGLEFEY